MTVPRPLTSFVGRTQEIGQVAGLLREHRLVTLSGVGGCGKTRLAIEALDRLDDRPRCWVDLGSVEEPDSVPRIVAGVLAVLVAPDSDPLAALTARLRDSRLLVCLDTCERVLEACAELADALLRHCPGVGILATSREPLRVESEVVWRVPSMSSRDANELFQVRAAQVAGAVPAAQAPRVEEICRRLDGIPLAIELAAAWVRVLTPAQIADGLDRAFDLLVGGPRGALPRQQTLAASMRWSHALLDDGDNRVFRRLGAFGGAFTLDAARGVCASGDPSASDIAEADVLPVLGRLVDKSLVVKVDAGDEARLRLLDTVRQYAQELLVAAGENDTVRDRHLAYFTALVEEAEPRLDEDQDTWRDRLEAHSADIRTALEWGLAGTGERARLGRRLAAAMARQWFVRGQAHEGLPLLRRAIDLGAGEESPLTARLLIGAAMLCMIAGRREDVAALAARAEPMGDRRTAGRAVLMRSFHQFFIDFQRCQDLAREARDLAGDADPFVRDWARVQESYSLQTRDRHVECMALAREAYDLSWPRGDRFCAAFALSVQLYEWVMRGELARARTIGQEALDIVAPLGDYFAVGTNTCGLAYALAWCGDLAGALELMRPIVRSLDEPDVDVVGSQVTMSQIQVFAGNLEAAWRWAEQGTRHLAPDIDGWTAARCRPVLAESLRRLGRLDEAAEQARLGVEDGRRYGSHLVVGRALTQQARLVAGYDLARAWDLQHEALATLREVNLSTLYVECLEGLAALAAQDDRYDEAARLLAAADGARDAIGAPRPPVELPEYQELVARLRESDSFAEHWSEGAAMDLEQAVAYATRGRGPRNRPASGWASLTPTELEVVRLVVEGLTNPQISDRLVVSRATVKTHLAHVYAKLGIANRTELAALATGRLR